MHEAITSHDIYFHVRILIGVVTGLALTRMLAGVAGIVQHPGKRPLYPTHLIWVATIVVSAIHFWWFEFGLIRVEIWRFGLFVFVLFYAFLFYLLASLLFPDDMQEYPTWEDYFLSRRRWFFGLFALTFVIDYFDTAVKGAAHMADLGLEYRIKLGAMFVLCVIAAWTSNRRYHIAFAALYLAYNVTWIVRRFDILG